jgi:hypothetical protein
MGPSVTLHDWKEWLVAAFGTTHEMMHIHVGLAIYVAVQLLQGTRRGSMFALNVVVAAEVLNELVDRLAKGWYPADTLSDVGLTLVWPMILTAVSQYRRTRWERHYRANGGLTPGMPLPSPFENGLAKRR